MPAVAAVGTFSYAGYTFGVMTKSSVEGRPVYDSAGRTITNVVWTITAETTVNAGAVTTTDATLEDIRRRLLTVAGELVYNGKGFGNNFSINTSTTKDVIWGPKPRLLSWQPSGGNLSAKVKWQVEVCLPECSNAQYTLRAMEYNFTVAYDIDDEGYTTRTYSGHVQIPQTRRTSSTRTLEDTADRLREAVTPEMPTGFRRRHQFTLSEDKCRLNFTIIDEELPAPLPQGVIRCEASHDVRNPQAQNLLRWVGTIRANYTLVRTLSRAKALEYFYQLVEDRIKKAKAFAILTDKGKRHVYITNFQFSESEIFGRSKMNFSCNYFFACKRDAILRASGLFTPVPGTDYARWKLSLAQTAHHPRGNVKMAFSKRDDAIVDLCANEPRISSSGGTNREERTLRSLPLRNECPPPDESFLHYDLRVKTQVLDEAAVLKALPEVPVDPRDTAIRFPLGNFPPPPGNAGRIVNNQQGHQLMYSQPKGTICNVQYRTTPTILVTLEGEALRACYPIGAPTLASVGGAELLPLNDEECFFETAIVGTFDPVKIVGASWRLKWIATEMPQGFLGVPPNPMV